MSYYNVRQVDLCKTIADKTMLNFWCPAELLDAIDALGQEAHVSEITKHGCDPTKTLLEKRYSDLAVTVAFF